MKSVVYGSGVDGGGRGGELCFRVLELCVVDYFE